MNIRSLLVLTQLVSMVAWGLTCLRCNSGLGVQFLPLCCMCGVCMFSACFRVFLWVILVLLWCPPPSPKPCAVSCSLCDVVPCDRLAPYTGCPPCARFSITLLRISGTENRWKWKCAPFPKCNCN